MYGNLISLIFPFLFISIHGQRDDDRDLPAARHFPGRTSKASFNAQFQRGRCPNRFYQLGDECVYLSTDGKIYSWKQTERACSRRISRLLKDQSPSNIDQTNMQPDKGVRQLVLNTPEKTELFRALSREYDEHNFAVRLPSDYNTLQRCLDGKDDKWPHYCTDTQNTSATCFETTSHGQNNDICLREVQCNSKYLRLVCEFTLPGSTELTDSKFHNCPNTRPYSRRVPIWGWIAISVVSAILLLIVLGIIFKFIRKSRSNGGLKKKSLGEPRQPAEKVFHISSKGDDQAAQPMLSRTGAANVSDTGYLQPQPSLIDNTANA